MATQHLQDIITLAELERREHRWEALLAAIPPWHPRNETGGGEGGEGGEGEGGEGGEGEGAAEGAAEGEGGGEGEGAEGGEGGASGEGAAGAAGAAGKDWKAQARKDQRYAKKMKEERDAAAAKLKEREDADKSEQEKAVEAARAEGEAKAESKYAVQRRDDKIESAVTRLAARGFEVKDGERDVTLRFADPDDAQLRLERALRAGDLEYDEIYGDGKANTDALREFLVDVLQKNKHLRAAGGNGGGAVERPEGGSDAGRGSGSGGRELEKMSPAEHLKDMQKAKS